MYQYSSQYDTMRHNLPDCDIAVFTKGKALSQETCSCILPCIMLLMHCVLLQNITEACQCRICWLISECLTDGICTRVPQVRYSLCNSSSCVNRLNILSGAEYGRNVHSMIYFRIFVKLLEVVNSRVKCPGDGQVSVSVCWNVKSIFYLHASLQRHSRYLIICLCICVPVSL